MKSDIREYKYKYGYWVYGSEDCPCCSGLKFDYYYLVSSPEDISENMSTQESSIRGILNSVIFVELGIDLYMYDDSNISITDEQLLNIISRIGVSIIIEGGRVDELCIKDDT